VGEYHDDDFDDWYDDEPYREPEPGCGKCNDSGAVWARIGASRGRIRRCPSCDPAWLRRLWLDLRWWWWRRRTPASVSGEAPF
jgi:hypothetical protein